MHRLLSRFLAIFALVIIGWTTALPVFADTIFTPTSGRETLDFQNGRKSGVDRETYADSSFMSSIESSMSSTFGNTFSYFRASNTGER